MTQTTLAPHVKPPLENQPTSTYFTQAGQELLEQSPDTIAYFLETASELVRRPDALSRGALEWISRGKVGFILGLPDYDDLCIKVVSPRTIRSKSLGHIPIPDMLTEVRYMDALKARFDAQSDVQLTTPTQYGLAKFQHGVVSLQERIPPEYASISSLRFELPDMGTSELEQSQIAGARAQQALGKSILRFGASDIHPKHDATVNSGNFLIHKERLAVDEELVYAVDLLGPNRMQRMVARGILLFG